MGQASLLELHSHSASPALWKQTRWSCPNEQSRRKSGGSFRPSTRSRSALTGFEPALGFVDDVYATLTAHDTAIAVPALKRAERVSDLHGPLLFMRRWAPKLFCPVAGAVVGVTRFELVTPSMSTKCSTAELYTRMPHYPLSSAGNDPKTTRRGGCRVGSQVYKRSRKGFQGLLVT